MWTRDTEAFWHHLNQYILTRPDKQLPIHVQEAAILFGSQENRTGIDNWPFSPSVRESYRRFNETAPKYDDMDIEPVRKALYPLFGHTYYYDYYLMDNLPKY
jgi:hypothetical protein